ncbi:PLP-dependent aminotransferase family protein [Labrenzia sp. PHM005]|uniref:aminotransferase-like domain-containing protein n=1 Tax=Labrenzia sp. PHM005 TaxID=2590016 RepID=UPI0011401F7F|nr:PLP-dependent aminotransferase family protein [Labrenzia sp. PHM005]QDG78017.1 PLP-dependent aminotransferase family protein [Labrenzia sp. PHM005]
MTDWRPDLTRSNAPRYLALADQIEQDIAAGRLKAGDRLPAQRRLAAQLGLDFTTVARGYTEAQRRGVISSQVGSGTFVSETYQPAPNRAATSSSRHPCPADTSMNLPPEPDDPALKSKMRDCLTALSADLIPLMRYQTFDGCEPALEAAITWLQRSGLTADPERIQIAPGAQAALAAILSGLTQPGDMIACERITYPGLRSLGAQMGLKLIGLPMDADGIEPDALETACQTNELKALYLNPTLQNPTTRTVPLGRRQALVEIAARYNIPILEDDPYSPLLPVAPLPFAALAPQNTWYIGSLSKSLGAGLRIAYVQAPNKKAAWQMSRALRASHVMPPPLMVALASQWVLDGTAAEICSTIAVESAERQKLAAKRLQSRDYLANSNGFHLWLALKNSWTRAAFASQVRGLGLGITESDAFTVQGTPAEAVRLCLGGPVSRSTLDSALESIANLLETSPEQASAYF